ncbi:MAG: helix-turn-helix transcriptional regulator [Tyzzerella sp.]|uniref:Helix-turn-helix transcriptional regulator n=1 Tax=Candidatus Fimicola merdigallinarum TaxID=2840819 RepID=A0A9D9H0M0_9FIRM|nr:helix-turn-helix transcriptional regulator [Candidatus Fimicola merdigallinarum]
MLNNIEAERARKRISKSSLAKELNVSLKTYYNWINEYTEVPSSALIKLSKIFGVSTDYLLSGSDYLN